MERMQVECNYKYRSPLGRLGAYKDDSYHFRQKINKKSEKMVLKRLNNKLHPFKIKLQYSGRLRTLLTTKFYNLTRKSQPISAANQIPKGIHLHCRQKNQCRQGKSNLKNEIRLTQMSQVKKQDIPLTMRQLYKRCLCSLYLGICKKCFRSE